MKWRLIDIVDEVDPWNSILGRKTVSLEEYTLLEPLGRRGAFPETLCLESCVHLVRWLVAASSDFQQSCTLLDVERFAFELQTRPGAAIHIAATVLDKREDTLRVKCRATVENRMCGSGDITVSLVALNKMSVPDDIRTLWLELYAKA